MAAVWHLVYCTLTGFELGMVTRCWCVCLKFGPNSAAILDRITQLFCKITFKVLSFPIGCITFVIYNLITASEKIYILSYPLYDNKSITRSLYWMLQAKRVSVFRLYKLCSLLRFIINNLGDNCIQNFHLGRYIVNSNALANVTRRLIG